MILVTVEVLGSTLVAAENVKVGLDDGTKMGSLTVSLEGSNDGIPKGLLLWVPIEESSCGD